MKRVSLTILLILAFAGSLTAQNLPQSVTNRAKLARWVRTGTFTFTNKTLTSPTSTSPTITGTGSMVLSSLELNGTLTLANDEAMFELAAGAAERALRELPDEGNELDQARLGRLFRICMVRPATAAELGRLTEYLQSERIRLGASGQSATAAWTSVARVIMNLDEFITRE